MRALPLLATCLAAGMTLGASAPKDATFTALARIIVEDTLRTSPEFATQQGDHRWDDRLGDSSADAVKKQLDWARHYAGLLRALPPASLSPANRVDREILLDTLDAIVQEGAELQGWRHNPMSYNPGGAIDSLLSREFAPLSVRLASVKGRLKQIPALVAAAKANLDNPPRLYTETAIQQLQGTLGLVRDEVTEAAAKAGLKEDLAPAQAEAVKALEDLIAWMKADLLPRSKGDFRLGKAAFSKQLRTTLSSGLTQAAILARAEASLKTTRSEMAKVARPLFEAWFPGRKETDEGVVIKAVLDHIAQKHPTNDTIVPLATKDLAEATDFVRSHDLMTIPQTPVKVIVMPEFARGSAVAYCDGPGALEKNGTTFYAISPTPADWSASRVDSFFREYNDAMVVNLTVHEAMPGHFLQGAVANAYKGETVVRSLFGSGLFAEGWAVYSEQLMAKAGFGGPEVRMQQLKMRLRVTINAILDQKIHTQGMTEAEGLALMENQGFQEEGEAVGKWKRACLSATQLSTYFVGASEMDDLRAAAEAKAKKTGKPFNVKAFHDQLLGYGTIAPKHLKVLMGL
jgi:uncharacterized protein (DUF885 family)